MPNRSLPTNRHTKAYLSGMPNRVALQITEKHRVPSPISVPSPSLLGRNRKRTFTKELILIHQVLPRRCSAENLPITRSKRPSNQGQPDCQHVRKKPSSWIYKLISGQMQQTSAEKTVLPVHVPPCLANALYSGVSSKFSGKARRRTCGVRKEVKTCGSVPRALEDFRGMCWTSPSKKGTMTTPCTPTQFFWTPLWLISASPFCNWAIFTKDLPVEVSDQWRWLRDMPSAPSHVSQGSQAPNRRTVLADTASTTQAQSGNLPLRRMAMTRSRRIVRKEGRFEDAVGVCNIDDCILHR